MSGRLPYPPALALIAIGVMSLAAAARADDAVVGDGTPASCTDAALDAALIQIYFGGSQGGRVSFNCGTTPVTIALASSKLLDAGVDTEIDGGGPHHARCGQPASPFRGSRHRYPRSPCAG
jgi:hypothetical protein